MTRRTAFNGSASGRRRERRAELQSEVTCSSEIIHCPTPSRAVLTLTRKVDRIEKAVEPVKNEISSQIKRSLELHQAIRNQSDKKNHRTWYSNPKGEFGVMATGKQKMRGKSISLL